MVGAIASGAVVIGAVVVAFYKKLRSGVKKDFEPVLKENERLRQELEERFKYPTFAKDAIELTEMAAQRKSRICVSN